MQIDDVYANFCDTVPLTCPHCQHQKAIPAAKFKDVPQPLTVACPCGTLFRVHIRIRRFYRKPTHLPGTYSKADRQTGRILEQGRMVVLDLSRTGAGLCTLYKHALAVDDVLTIAFTLDNEQHTKIEKRVCVRRVDDKGFGVEFMDHDARTEENRQLGFYLLPQAES